MTAQSDLQEWPDRLESVITSQCNNLKRVTVLKETGSTQDAARRFGSTHGDVYVAWRQRSGRGRRGRMWVDTGEEGIAVSFCLANRECERLALICAVGSAMAIEAIRNQPVGIKWPNDIVVGGRKLGGILIETFDSLAVIGIGINVLQTSWPSVLENRAVSLIQLGAHVDRLDVATQLIQGIDGALDLTDADLQEHFTVRSVLHGTSARFSTGGKVVSGTVTQVDPLHGLEIRTFSGPMWLPAMTTTVLQDE